MNPQNPQDPQNQQYQPYQPVETPPPTPMGNPFASSDVNFKPHHDRPRISVGKLLKRLSAVVVAFGMIAGIGYGVNYFLGIADREQQAYNARLAEEVGAQTDENIYIGNGADILEVKPAQTIQGCPAGYEEVGEACQKNELISVPAAQYSCPTGYTLAGSGSGTTCSRVEGGTKESIPATVQATCTDGYTLKNGGCVKTEVAPFIVVLNCEAGFVKSQLTAETATCSRQETQNGTVRSGCPSGYTVSGSGCVTSRAATANTSPTCPSGYSYASATRDCRRSDSGSCPSGYSYVSNENVCARTASYLTAYRCPDGFTVSGSNCVRQYTTPTQCASGYTRLDNNICRRQISATSYTSCPTGYSPYGSVCRQTTARQYCAGAVAYGTGTTRTCVATAGSSTSYSCPSGFSLSGTTCSYRLAQAISCDPGFSLTGSSCTRIIMTNKEPTRQNTCPATYSIASSDCQREATAAAIQALSCGAGYTKEGSQCTKINGGRTVTVAPNVSYSCAAGFTQVGTGNDAKCEKRELLSSPRIEQQACEEGWSKRIIGTTIDCVRTA